MGEYAVSSEFKRTSNDFSVRPLTQNNCICSVCHGTGATWEFRFVTRNYASPRRKNYICKTLQEHEHSFWVCPKCLMNFTRQTGVQMLMPVVKGGTDG